MNHVLNVRIEGAVARLTLNRPDKLNALSNEMLEAIIRTLDRIELDAAVRAVVITRACF
jgi:enoyl-CoA hydratase/carnithine racemase